MKITLNKIRKDRENAFLKLFETRRHLIGCWCLCKYIQESGNDSKVSMDEAMENLLSVLEEIRGIKVICFSRYGFYKKILVKWLEINNINFVCAFAKLKLEEYGIEDKENAKLVSRVFVDSFDKLLKVISNKQGDLTKYCQQEFLQ